MSRYSRVISFSIAAVWVLFLTPHSFAAETKSRFDLPAEPLDKALRDFAIQAKRNISYQPSLVAGHQAPAIKGDYVPADVLAIMLMGTRLQALNVDDDTVAVVDEQTSRSGRDAAKNGANDAVVVGYADMNATGTDDGGPSGTPGKHQSDYTPVNQKDLEEITVTGSHIRGAASASPVLQIGREEIERSGYTSISDLMLSVPQNFGGGYNAANSVANSQINNRYSDNPSGASVPNLRGLGPGSTLSLLNGRRMASGLSGGGADISSIPIDAIERVDVVTDSASAVYGSDAVAGVVNVILKKNYDGAISSISYGAASQGGGTERRASLLGGTSWTSGSVMLAFEHFEQGLIDAGERGFASSALRPTSLLPAQRSNSLALSATQQVAGPVSGFFDGLYIWRDTDSFATNQFLPTPFEYRSTLGKFTVTTGLSLDLAGGWKGTIFGSAAKDLTKVEAVELTQPSQTLSSAEHLEGTTRSIEANADGTLAELPTGALRLAVGVGYRRESFAESAGFTEQSLTTGAEGDRNVRYAFGEVSVPLLIPSARVGLNRLDLVVSGRNERYSDFGSKTVPKIGLVYGPTSFLNIRSTWGQAFRAPNLYDTTAVRQLIILDLPNPASPLGTSPVLIQSGGNPELRPETATAWSMGADYSPPQMEGLSIAVTGFDIHYANRIGQIANPFTALTDPLNAFFVTPTPSRAAAQALYDQYPANQIFNDSSSSFDPTNVGAILDYRSVNVASQTARGADMNINYRVGQGPGDFLLFLNGTYLKLTQHTTPQSPEQTLTGLAFYPPRFRMRSGATWRVSAWALTGTINYLARETNNQVTPLQSVGSWTTVDASVRYMPALPGPYSRLSFNLSAINLFDKSPPLVLLPAVVEQGFNYDASNTSPVGRFIRLQVSKRW